MTISKIKKFFLRYYVQLVLILINLVVYHIWFFNSSILTHGDWMFNQNESSRELFNLPFIWKTLLLGNVDFTPSFYPFLFFEGILAQFNISYAFIERIIFMWPIVIITSLSSFYLIRYITKNNIASFVGSLVYSYNTYYLILQTGHLTLMMGFALIPLALLLFTKMLEKNSYFFSILTGLCAFVISYYEFRVFYLFAILLILYYLYYVFIIKKNSSIYILKSSYIKALLPIFLVLLLNCYWLLGIGITGRLISNNEILSRDLFGGEFVSIGRAFALFQSYWTGHDYEPFVLQPIPFYFFIIPIIVFAVLMFNKKNKYALFYILIALIGIFLIKQENPPFEHVYSWLFQHVPGFNAFRDSTKFYFLVALGYSVLIGIFINWLGQYLSKNKFQIIGKFLLIITIIFIFIWNTKPLITTKIGTLFAPRSVPIDYKIFNSYINSQNEYFRTLWLPMDSRWGVHSNLHPKISTPYLNIKWQDIIAIDKSSNKGSTENNLVNIFRQSFSNRLLNFLSVKYVIVPIQDKANDNDFFPYFGNSNNRNFFIKELNKIDYLDKVDLQMNDLIIYKNNNFRPHIYTTMQKETIYSDIPYQEVDYVFINPTEYKISLRDIKSSIYINFTENFHPEWKIRVGKFNWFDAIMHKNYFISDDNHFQNEAKLNSFRIVPEKICSFYVCTKNSNGSYDINLTLYFKPQSHFYLGFIISIATLLCCILYIIVTLGMRKIKKHKFIPKK